LQDGKLQNQILGVNLYSASNVWNANDNGNLNNNNPTNVNGARHFF